MLPQVNSLLVELTKGNSRLQLVNIDTGVVQASSWPNCLYCVPSPSLPQLDQSILHHDMWDYLELTQKGYTKAFEPVNELLSQVTAEISRE